MRTPHSSTNKGKRVKVTMRNGTVVIGKFNDKKSGTIILEFPVTFTSSGMAVVNCYVKGNKVRLQMKDVRAFSIYKPTK